MKSLIILLILFISPRAQFIDPYGIYTNYTSTVNGFYQIGICTCERDTQVNTVTFNNIKNITFGSYTFQGTQTFKINITTTDIVNIITDHTNNIRYSLDGTIWSNTLQGHAYICGILGEVLIEIVPSISNLVRFYLFKQIECNNSLGTNGTFATAKIKGYSTLSYVTYGYGFAIFIYSNTTGCTLDTYLYYTGPNNNKYNYSIGSSYAQSVSYTGSYTLVFYISPENKDIECNIIVQFSNIIINTPYTAPVLFYNNTQIIKYLILNQTYDPSWNGTLVLDGGTSVNSPTVQIKNLNNSQVYQIFSEYNLIDNVTYFQPLLIENGEYIDTSVILNPNFTFTQDLTINMSTVNLNTTRIPVNLTVQDADIILSKNTSVNGISFYGNNTIIGENTLNIVGSANFSGVLNINRTFGSDPTYIIMTYNSSQGQFSTVNTSKDSISEGCRESKPVYTKNQLEVHFTVNERCDAESKEPDGILYYVVIPIVVILVVLILIAAILILKVPAIRKRVFPHRDRPYYINSTPSSEDMKYAPSTYTPRGVQSSSSVTVPPISRQAVKGPFASTKVRKSSSKSDKQGGYLSPREPRSPRGARDPNQ